MPDRSAGFTVGIGFERIVHVNASEPAFLFDREDRIPRPAAERVFPDFVAKLPDLLGEVAEFVRKFLFGFPIVH
jgi:hypothetical protein